jgi:hypothetical protein
LPLTRGHYPLNYSLFAALGATTNIANPQMPIRSNAEFFGGFGGLSDQSAATITAKANGIVVPVDPGTTITKVGFKVGATACATSTHSNVCLYAGGLAAPTKLGTQSTDVTTGNGGFPASAWNIVTLGAAYTVTAADAPQGYIYVSFGSTATTQPSLAGWTYATAIGYTDSALNSATTNPLFMSAAYTGGGAAAPATLASGAVTGAVPLVVLL